MKELLRIIKYLFSIGGKYEFRIFKNSHYSGSFSVEYKGGFLYINPPAFGGAGLSASARACGSPSTIRACLEFVNEWAKAKGLDVSQVKVIHDY